jgi:FlaA1/EpsC-like NDP-sugar epimerase
MGMYHRYKYNPEHALVGVFIGFLFNVLIVYFIKQYNFSRIASFYCWGFNSILISGWRFVSELFWTKDHKRGGRKTLVIGTIFDAVKLRTALHLTGMDDYDILGCIETSENAIRGSEREELHVLGLIDDMKDIIKDYSIDVVMMTGSNIPFSKILSNYSGFGSMRPEFKLVPELKSIEEIKKTGFVTIIDIHSGKLFGAKKRQ